jgi:hypothetical protein
MIWITNRFPSRMALKSKIVPSHVSVLIFLKPNSATMACALSHVTDDEIFLSFGVAAIDRTGAAFGTSASAVCLLGAWATFRSAMRAALLFRAVES